MQLLQNSFFIGSYANGNGQKDFDEHPCKRLIFISELWRSMENATINSEPCLIFVAATFKLTFLHDFIVTAKKPSVCPKTLVGHCHLLQERTLFVQSRSAIEYLRQHDMITYRYCLNSSFSNQIAFGMGTDNWTVTYYHFGIMRKLSKLLDNSTYN